MATHALAPIAASQWNPRTARHLLNRAGFGIPRARVEALAAMTPESAVESLLDFPESTLPMPGFVLPPVTREARREAVRALSDEERRAVVMERQRQERMAMRLLKGWWLERMVGTPDPLEEKLTLMWHSHFATSAQKVRSSHANWNLHQTLRRHAAGNVRTLTTAVGQSPAMLQYLDNAVSTRENPNENWARELLELFTLGQGTYTEQDIKEAARAFTGWTTDEAEFVFLRRRFDNGPKNFLGVRGRHDGHDIIRIIFEQPACGRHIAARLWSYFGSERQDEAIIEAMADSLRANEYELRPVLRELFLAQAFYDDAVIGAQIKSPAQLAVQLVHDLGLDPMPAYTMAEATARLGQDLFYPPNVKGWDGNSAWVNANTMLLRVNLPGTLITAGPRERSMAGRTAALMPMSPETAVCAEGDEAMKGGAGAVSPLEEMMQDGRMAQREGATAAAMSQLPEEVRLRVRRQMNAAETPAAADGILQRALRRHAESPSWRPGAMLQGIHRRAPIRESMAAILDRHLAAPLTPAQRELLLEALGVTGDAESPATLAEATPANLRAALHLMLSTAEYQLC